MKRILFTSLIAFYSISLSAQVIFIPKIGVSFAGLSKKAQPMNYDPGVKLGFVGGVAAGIILSKHFAFQPELLFHQKGYTYFLAKENMPYKEYKRKEALNYLEIPLLITGGWDEIYISFGASFGYGLGGKYTEKYTYDDGTFSERSGRVRFRDGDAVRSYDYVNNRIEIAAQFTLGYKISEKFLLDMRYSYGLTNIYSKNPGIAYATKKSTNLSLQVMLGIPIKELIVGYK